MQLERLARKSLPVHPPLPEDLRVLTTPIEQSFWQQHLQSHPDQQFAKLILQGLTSGFFVFVTLSGKTRVTENRFRVKIQKSHQLYMSHI